MPHWAKAADVKLTLVAACRTDNARSDTVRKKPSFRDARRRAQHGSIPAEAVYEPDARSGKPRATRIRRADGKPLGTAGLWSGWKAPDGSVPGSFAMLTVKTDGHALMQNFHRPDDEKRIGVILHQWKYDAWLDAPPEQSMACMRQ